MLSTQYNDQVLYLEGSLQVHHLDGIKDEMVAFAADAKPLTVDVSQIADLDLAGLQMVLAFLGSRKGETKLVGLSKEFGKALSISGLEPHFAPFTN